MPDIEKVEHTYTVNLLISPACGHKWEPRTEEPKQCPGCRVRLAQFRNKGGK